MRLSALGLAALRLSQEHGFWLFPVYEPRAVGVCSCTLGAACERIGKHPRTDGGFKDATTHPEQIAAWWDEWPTANIGLYPGGQQLLVLDIDGPTGDDAARARGAFDVSTLEAVTARGVHRYYRVPDGIRFGNSARRELDVRAHKGYVLAAPSVHASGHVYAWRGDLDSIANIPARTLAAILTPRDAAPAQSAYALPPVSLAAPDALAERRVLAYAARLGYGLSDGRKTGAFRFAAFLSHDVGLGEGAAWAYLTTWNAHNAPPLGERKLTEILANARQYGGRNGIAA